MASVSKKRILRELKQLPTELPDDIKLIQPDSSLSKFYFDIKVLNNPLYPKEDTYRLRFKMDDNYPFESPEVQFILDKDNGIDKIPIHPHIYSNGHICLDILGDNWVPVHSMLSTTLSIHSLLVSNDRDERPPDDKTYDSKNPKLSRFVYHDNTV